jgi:hypothetical protein
MMGPVSDLQSEVVRSVEELIRASSNAREVMRQSEQTLRRGLKKVELGDDLASAIGTSKPAESRQTVNDALTKLEQCRHQARIRIFALGLDQGLSIGELGRAWGISRQMASRYAKEARAIGRQD